jgi:hypothetical protein
MAAGLEAIVISIKNDWEQIFAWEWAEDDLSAWKVT